MLPEARLLSSYSSIYRNLAPGSTGSVVKAAAGQIYSVIVSNTDTNNVYLKLYDKATAPSSSDTPVMTIGVVKGTSTIVPLGAEPVSFANGISIRAVQGQADNDTTAPTSATCTVNLLYK